jgi:hypothetical protein
METKVKAAIEKLTKDTDHINQTALDEAWNEGRKISAYKYAWKQFIDELESFVDIWRDRKLTVDIYSSYHTGLKEWVCSTTCPMMLSKNESAICLMKLSTPYVFEKQDIMIPGYKCPCSRPDFSNP